MFFVAQHSIADPKNFWETVIKIEMPKEIKLHSTLPNPEGTKAVCLWEASAINEVKNFVEGAVGKYSKNEYYLVEAKNAMGLPK